jgi:glycosyltransferase involved in cell wall biosynthesis
MRVPWFARTELVLSLTSRTPIAARRQVVTIHDLFPLTNPEWFSLNYVTLHRRLIRANLRRADAIVTVSEPVRDAIVSIVNHRVPVVVAPNAPTAHLTCTDGSGTPIGALATSRYLLSVGSVEPRKNMTRLIEAYLTLPRAVRRETPLVVVGGTNPVFGRVIPAAGCDDTVRLLGRVSDAELAWLYSTAAAFVAVSLAEGFGIPIVEAAAAGCPAFVLSDIPAYRWLTKATTPIFVDPLDRDIRR